MSASGYLAWAQSKEGFRDQMSDLYHGEYPVDMTVAEAYAEVQRIRQAEVERRTLEQLNLTGDQCEAVTVMVRNARIEGAAVMKQFAINCMADLGTSLNEDFGLWSSPSFARCRSAAYRAWRDIRNLNPLNFARLGEAR